jgi:hypothetical protein
MAFLHERHEASVSPQAVAWICIRSEGIATVKKRKKGDQ